MTRFFLHLIPHFGVILGGGLKIFPLKSLQLSGYGKTSI